MVVVIIAAVITAAGNILDGKHAFGPSLVGCFVLAGIAFAGAVLSYLPGFKKFTDGILGFYFRRYFIDSGRTG
mgnify:CR=1 FL=1